MKVDLVLEGGGVLGIAFIGALSALENYGYTVNKVAGTSAGALMGSLISAGYNSQELIELLSNTDFKLFKHKTGLSNYLLFGKVASLIKNKGIYSHDYLETWIYHLLEQKQKTTFKEHQKLKIIASDITNRKIMVLPDDLTYYGFKKNHFLVSKAVAMSSSIPYYFTPIKIKQKEKTDFIVDGGLLSNFPIWIFDSKEKPRWPTFGIKIKDEESYTSQNKTGFIPYSRDLINATISKDEISYVKDKDLIRTITIDHNKSLKATDFDITKDQIQYLFKCGYQSTLKFLKNFDFNQYCRLYRKD